MADLSCHGRRYHRRMADDTKPAWFAYNAPKRPPRQAKSGELLFEFVRQHDHKHFRFELRFHGESYGWEVQIFDGGEFLSGRGRFFRRADAIAWAEDMRNTIGAFR